MRLGIVALVAVILAAGGVTLASADSGKRAGDGRSEVIKLFALTDLDQSADLDLGATGESVGDRFVFSDDLYTRKGGDKVGIDGGECIVVRLDTAARSATVQCAVTASLDDRGQITVQGLVTFSESEAGATFTLPITGGSGDFRGASGEITVEELSDTESNLTLSLD